MFARLILSVWAGSGQFIAPSGPESREHRGQVSLSLARLSPQAGPWSPASEAAPSRPDSRGLDPGCGQARGYHSTF